MRSLKFRGMGSMYCIVLWGFDIIRMYNSGQHRDKMVFHIGLFEMRKQLHILGRIGGLWKLSEQVLIVIALKWKNKKEKVFRVQYLHSIYAQSSGWDPQRQGNAPSDPYIRVSQRAHAHS